MPSGLGMGAATPERAQRHTVAIVLRSRNLVFRLSNTISEFVRKPRQRHEQTCAIMRAMWLVHSCVFVSATQSARIRNQLLVLQLLLLVVVLLPQ